MTLRTLADQLEIEMSAVRAAVGDAAAVPKDKARYAACLLQAPARLWRACSR